MLLHIWASDKMDKKTFEDFKILFTLNLRESIFRKRFRDMYAKNYKKYYNIEYYDEYYALIRDASKKINLNEEEKDKIKNIVEINFNANLEMIKEYVKYLSLFFDKTPLPKMSLPGLICEYSKKMSIISSKEIRPIDVMKSNEKVKDVINALSKIEYTKYSKPLFKFLDKTTTNIEEESEIKNYLVSKIPGYAKYKAITLSKLL